MRALAVAADPGMPCRAALSASGSPARRATLTPSPFRHPRLLNIDVKVGQRLARQLYREPSWQFE